MCSIMKELWRRDETMMDGWKSGWREGWMMDRWKEGKKEESVGVRLMKNL